MDMSPEKKLLAALKEPFSLKEIHWRVGATNAKKLGVKPWEATSGIALTYINSRDVMKRLDEVCGVDGWQSRYPYAGCCEIGIRVGDEWIWKSNGAGATKVDPEKGQFSDAFKRAATMWGIGRYLYYLPSPWVPLQNGNIVNTPPMPKWALPREKTSEG